MCTSPADVQRCVEFARTHGITPIPRCGGHSYGGYSTGAGLVIDVTPMHDVVVTGAGSTGAAGDAGGGAGNGGTSAPGATAVVGAGTLLVDLYDQLSQAGVLVPGGSCPTVGISGLALGGGVGVVGRKYGLTCDVIESVQVVTADGRVLTCDAGTHEDLYWACRGGGGGNFGVVTSFTFRAAPIPELALFTLDWPWPAAADVLGAWLTWQHAAPDELWSNCQLSSRRAVVPWGCGRRGCSWARRPRWPRWWRRLVAAVGTQPSYRFVGPEQYLHAMLVEAGCESLDVAQCHLTTPDPDGGPRPGRLGGVFGLRVGVPAAAGHRRLRAESSTTSSQHAPGTRRRARLRRLRGCHQRREAGRHGLRPPRRRLCGIQASVATGADASAVRRAGPGWPISPPRWRPYVDGSAYQNYIDPTLADWQQRLLRGQSRSAGVGEGGLRPRRRVPLRPVHPHPPHHRRGSDPDVIPTLVVARGPMPP